MKHFYVGNSKIEGKGLIAGENITRNKIITRIKGPACLKINKTKKDAQSNPDWVGVRKNIWIDPLRPHKFLNHSCNPNAGMRGLTIMSIKDIKEGDEITIDYSTQEGDTRWEMKCSCEAVNCRGTIRSVQFLSKKQFQSIPHIPAYFRKLHTKSKAGRVYNK